MSLQAVAEALELCVPLSRERRLAIATVRESGTVVQKAKAYDADVDTLIAAWEIMERVVMEVRETLPMYAHLDRLQTLDKLLQESSLYCHAVPVARG